MEINKDRILTFSLMVIGDLMLFGGIVTWIILNFGEKRRRSVVIAKQRYFQRQRLVKKGNKRTGALFIYLILQTHVGVQGRSAPINVEDEAGINNFDETSLMARSPSAPWEPPAIPSPHSEAMSSRRRTEEGSQDSGGSQGEDFHQMAFIFALSSYPVSAKLNWDHYWTLHRQVARICGVGVDDLLAIHGVRHLPEDLEDIEVQVLLPQRTGDTAHGEGQVFTLVDIEYLGGLYLATTPTERRARLVPKSITRSGMLRFLNLEHRCVQQNPRCLMWLNNGTWKEQDVRLRTIKHGDFIRCAIPPHSGQCEQQQEEPPESPHNMETTEEEGISLMQTRADQVTTSQTPTSVQTRSATIFLFGSDRIDLELEVGDIAEINEELWTIWSIPREETEDFHEVYDPPFSLQVPGNRVLLLEKIYDANYNFAPTDILALVDIQINQISGDSRALRRRVIWMSYRMKRTQLSAHLRIDRLCEEREVVECVLAINNDIWPEQDQATRHFRNGDYVRVDIFQTQGPADDMMISLRSQEICDMRRRIFTDSPSSDRIGGDRNERGNSGGPPRERSRSRSRGEAPGSVEDAPWDLLRLKGSGRERRANWEISTFELLPPPGNPSNEEQPVEIRIANGLHERSSEADEDGSRNDTAIVFNIDDDTEATEWPQKPQKIFEIAIPEDINQVMVVLQPWTVTPLRLDLPENLEIPSTSLQFIMDCKAGWNEQVESIHIYTDGSSGRDRGTAGFAMAVFGWNQGMEGQRHTFLGWIGSPVILDENHPNFVGAERLTAKDAEASGLMWAHIWVLQSGIELPVTFHFDALAIGRGATGEWNLDGSSTIQLKLREIVQFSSQLRSHVKTEYEHVKAHSSHPCNEFVDACAKFYQEGQEGQMDGMPGWQPLFRKDSTILTHAWWWVKSLRGDRNVPAIWGSVFRWERGEMAMTQNGVANIEHQLSNQQDSFTVSMRVLTLNVMTLRNKKTDQGEQGEDWKAALLRSQFQQQRVQVAGLQETRATNSCTLNTTNYTRYISAGEGGSYGCELWFSKLIPMIKNVPDSTFEEKNATVVESTPRLLMVSCCMRGCSILFVSAHAPHEEKQSEDKDGWWENFRSKINSARRRSYVCIMGDFNARLGEGDLEVVGGRTCPATNDNGMRLFHFMQDHHCWAPSTFDEVHEGQDWTWTHPRGSRARLDYIIVSQEENFKPWCSKVMKDIQSSLTIRDHEAVYLDFEIYETKGRGHQPRRTYNWEALHTEWGANKLKEIVAQLPDPCWEDDVHVHWQKLEDGLHAGLLEHFPPKAKRSRKDIFSSTTWTFLEQRKACKQGLDQCDDALDNFEVKGAIRAWKDGETLKAADRLNILNQWLIVLAHIFFKNDFRRSAKELRQSLMQDKTKYIESVVENANKSNMNDLYAQLRPLRIGGAMAKRGLPPLPGFKRPGEDIADPQGSDQIWMEHCAVLEAGVATTTRRLLQRARKHANHRLPDGAHLHVDTLPTLSMLEGAFRHVKPRKAGGADDLKSDVCELAAPELATKFYPLLVKIYAQTTEPIQMKGGVLIPAYKGGQATNPSDHRSLLLSSHIGKALRRTMRTQLTVPFTQSAPQTHFAIKPGGCVSHASHSLRLFVQAAGRRNESVGILYLDVRSAYYRVVRQLAIGGQSTPDHLHRILRYFDLGQTSIDDLMEAIQEEPSCTASGMEEHQERLLQELLTATWFSSKRKERLYESLAGTRPGDGLADLTFGYVFKKIMAKAMMRINEAIGLEKPAFQPKFDLTKTPPEDIDLPKILEIVWADDLAVAFRSHDAAELKEGMEKIVAIIIQENINHALIPNLKPGKTEVQLILKGKRSRQVRGETFNTSDPKLIVQGVPPDFQAVRIVATYRHLGTRVDVSNRHLADVKARMGQAHQVYRKHRKMIFQNKMLSRAKRLFLFNGLVLSVLSYNVGTWGRLLASEMKYFKTKLYSMYRGMLRCEIGELDLRLWSNDRVLAALQLPTAEITLMAARLRYSTTLYTSAPDALWHLVGAESEWAGTLREAQSWLKEQLKGYGPGPSGHEWAPDLHAWCTEGVKGFKQWIGRAVEHSIQQHIKKVEWREWHFNFIQESIRIGLEVEQPQPHQEDFMQKDRVEACLQCHRTFKNRAAWAVHAFKSHGRTNQVREVMDGTRCHACGREYYAPSRLQAHLNYSGRCHRKLIQAGRRNPNLMPGIGSTMSQRDRKLKVPVQKSYGPREQAFEAPDWPDEERIDLALIEGLLDFFEEQDPEVTLEELVSGVKNRCTESYSSFWDIKKTLGQFADNVEAEEIGETCKVPPVKVSQSTRIAWRRFEISWFFEPQEIKAEATDDSIRNAAWIYCFEQTEMPQWKRKPYVPRMRTNTVVLLHLFSGNRRAGDLHSTLSAMQAPPGSLLMVLSVDIIYDEKAGNLADEENQRQWYAWVRSGLIIGVYAGPPCETWSRARLKGGVPCFSKGDGGPRLLRDACHPAGFDWMKVKEVRQVILANRLLGFTIMVMLYILEMSLFMLVEHPGEPPQEEEGWLASIWRLFLTKAIRNNPNVHLARIFQGHYGAKSPKPTNLMICAGPDFPVTEILEGLRSSDSLPQQLEMGWNAESKEYSTASLKSYPPDLCRALAGLTEVWMERFMEPVVGLPPLPSQFTRFTEALLNSFNLSVERGADYHAPANAS